MAGFEFYLRREREASGNTVAAYCYWLRLFAEWCSANRTSVLRATPVDIRSFSTSKDWSRKTRSQLLSALKAFYRYCVLDGFLPYSPAESLPHPRLFATKGPIYDDAEARKLLQREIEPTNRFIVAIGLYAGLRTGEALGLEPADIDFKHSLICVRRTMGEPTTKGKREREIPMHASLREPLRIVCRVADERLMSIRTTEGYRARFKRICERSGVPYKGPHALRRSFGTKLGINGVREGVIRELMGHVPSVTDLYVQVTMPQKRSAIRRLSF